MFNIESKFNLLEKYFLSIKPVKRGSHKVVAGIFDSRGRIVSFGNNSSWKTHPKVPIVKKETAEYQCIHVEVHAIFQALNFVEELNKKYSILVFRKGNDGKRRMSRPCKNCCDYIKKYNLKCFYINQEGNIEKLLTS